MPSFKVNESYDYLPDQSIDPRYIHDERNHYLLPNNDRFREPLISPVFASPEDIQALPPTLIQIGDAEKIRDESILFACRAPLSRITVEMYEDMVHVFHMVRFSHLLA